MEEIFDLLNYEDFVDEFVVGSILVSLKKSVSEINKEWKLSDFPEADIESIKDLSWIDGDITNKKYLNYDNFHQIFEFTLKDKSIEGVLQAIKQLQCNPNVKYASPNTKIYADRIPNDTYYPNQWGLPKINAPAAWDITVGVNTPTCIVGVLDSGIDSTHPDLMSNVNMGLAANFTGDSYGNTDPAGHGTQVAGVIGAVGNNSQGIAGVNWAVMMTPLRVLDSNTSGSSNWIAVAVNYAIVHDIGILNCSVGFPTLNSSVLQAISNYDGLIVCSAGNEINDNDIAPRYPGSFRLDNVIAVGASDSADNLWVRTTIPPPVGSNYGATNVDLFAPGHQIYTTVLGNSYGYKDGTSFSTPMVTGVAALIKSINPSLNSIQLKNFIMNNVDLSPNFAGKCVTGGRLNAFKAVNKAKLAVMGLSSKGSGGLLTGPNFITACRAIAGQNMTVDTLSLYVENPIGMVRLALYRDSSTNPGNPGDLIAETDNIILKNGWNSGAITPKLLTAGITYWLAYNLSAGGGSYNTTFYNSGGLMKERSYSYGPFPNTISLPLSSMNITITMFASGNTSKAHLGLDANVYNSNSPAPNYFSAVKVQAGQNITVDTLNFYVQGAYGSVRLGLYADNAGNPGSLLAQTDSILLHIGWNSGGITPTRIIPGRTYWLVFSFSTSGNTIYYDPVGLTVWGSYSYGVLPGTAPPTPSSMVGTFMLFASGNAWRMNTGMNVVASNRDYPSPNTFIATRVTAGQYTTVHNLNIYVQNASGSAILGLYNDNGNPTSLLAQTSVISLVNGWNTGEISPVNLIITGRYWLVVNFSNPGNIIFYDSTGITRWVSYPFGTLPSTAPALPNSVANSYSFYAGN